VEDWLKLYSKYANVEFGGKLLSYFPNYFSEIEVYRALKRAGCSPEKRFFTRLMGPTRAEWLQ